MADGWFPDPAARHAQRYFDGERWTEHVASPTGQMSTDPIWLAAPPPVADSAPPPNQPSPPPAYPPGVVYAAPSGRANDLAIASLVLGIVWICWIGSVLAVIFGHIALHQIGASGGREGGRGMALAGVILGWTALGILAIVMFGSS